MQQRGSNWKDFHEILLLDIFIKCILKTQASLQSDKNKEYFT
jgi:hypothetical protein